MRCALYRWTTTTALRFKNWKGEKKEYLKSVAAHDDVMDFELILPVIKWTSLLLFLNWGKRSWWLWPQKRETLLFGWIGWIGWIGWVMIREDLLTAAQDSSLVLQDLINTDIWNVAFSRLIRIDLTEAKNTLAFILTSFVWQLRRFSGQARVF